MNRFSGILWSLGSVTGLQLTLAASGVIAARALGPDDRGSLAIMALIPSIIATIVPFGLDSSIVYFGSRSPEQTLPRLLLQLRTTLFLQIVLCFIASGLLTWALSRGWDSKDQVVAYAGAGVSVFLLTQRYAFSILQTYQSFAVLGSVRLSQPLLYALLAILAYSTNHRSLVVFAVSWFGAGIVATLGSVYLCVQVMRSAPVSPSNPEPCPSNRTLLTFGAKSFVSVASPYETFRVDQFAVATILGSTSMGLYAAAQAMSNFPRLVANSLISVGYPRIAGQPAPEEARRIFKVFTIGSSLATVTMGVILVALIPYLIPALFGDDFRETILTSQLLVCASVAAGMSRILADGARGLGYATIGSIAEIAMLPVLLAGIFIGAAANGNIGVAIGNLAAATGTFTILGIWMLRKRRSLRKMIAHG